jgi:hypothetical protein
VRKILIAIAIAGQAALFVPLYAQTSPRVLVLGTDSKAMTDIQDRILRETVMRELLSGSVQIVSVMDLERAIQLEGIDIRKVSSSVAALADQLGARFSIRGMISSSGSSYMLTVEDNAAGKRYETEIPLKAGESFQSCCPVLAKKIAARTLEILHSVK